MPNFIYMEAAPVLKGEARKYAGSYRKMAVVELEDDFEGRPKMISERARGVVRVVANVTAHMGSTMRSYGYRERIRLKELADDLNNGEKDVV
jgi:hypothetical protein